MKSVILKWLLKIGYVVVVGITGTFPVAVHAIVEKTRSKNNQE